MPSPGPPPPLDLGTAARRFWPYAVLAMVPLLLAAPALGGSWVLDDRFLIAQSARVQDLGAFRSWFSASLFDVSGSASQLVGQMAYYRPLVVASYALDWAWGSGSPVAFHFTNAVLAGVAAVLAGLALRRWSGVDRPRAPALLAAILWAAHPVHADSVAWISGRPDLLLAVGMLAASAGIARRLAGERRGVALEIGGTVLAYLSKESAVTLPALAVLECLAAGRRGGLSRGATARVVAPQVGVAALYLVARAVWMPLHGGLADGAPLAARVGRVLETYGRYGVLAIWPSDLSLFRAAVHGTGAAPVIAVPYAVAGAILIAAVAALATTGARRSPATWGAALFVILLLPVANLVPIGGGTLVAARLLFVPTLGIALALAACPVPSRPQLARVAAGLAALVVAAASARSFARARDYRSEEAFWAVEAAHNPEHPAVLSQAMTTALTQKRYAAAVTAAHRAYAAATGATPDPRVAAGAILGAVQALAALTRDADVEGLSRLSRFCGAVIDPAATRAVLVQPEVQLDVPLDGSPVAQHLRELRPLALAVRSDLESRGGDDERAAADARASIAACPRCDDLHLTAALALARAGAFREAIAALPEAPAWAFAAQPLAGHVTRAAQLAGASRRAPPEVQLRLEAQRWMELSAWGRAWQSADRSLATDRDAGRAPPDAEDRVALAELAFRAGAGERAAALLEGAVPPAEARRLSATWARSMGWD
jgi:protein O-mannosyl-transferase